MNPPRNLLPNQERLGTVLLKVFGWLNDLKIFVKLGVFSALVLLPFLATMIWVFYTQSGAVVERNAGVRLKDAAFSLMDRLDRSLGERYNEVQVFAASPEARSMDASEIQKWMNTITKAYAPIYRMMLVTDLEGKVIAASGLNVNGQAQTAKTVIGSSMAAEDWFQQLQGESFTASPDEGKTVLSDLTRDKLVEKAYGADVALTLGFSSFIFDDTGSVVGYWSTRYNWQETQKTIAEVEARAAKDNASTLRFVIAKNNQIIESSRKADTFKREITDSAFQVAENLNIGFGQGVDYSQPQGQGVGIEGWFKARGILKDLGWQTLVSQSLPEVNRERDATVRALLLVGALGVLVVAAAMYLPSWYLAWGVERLKRAASGLSQGNLAQSIGRYGRDELGDLANSFRSMRQYQREMAEVANHISSGDLTKAIEAKSEQDVLGQAFTGMRSNLRDLLSTVQSGSVALASASSQILASTGQQTSTVSSQLAAVSQTTATVDEVKTTSEQAVELAQTINEQSQSVNRVATAGAEAAKAANDGMSEIRARVQQIAENILALSQQTQQIGEIIATVGDIADQSNLLALNAAIEASRAGEQGKGFAVVAQEIRLLAEQSKNATAQVRSILGEIQRATNSAVMTTEQGIKVADAGVDSIARVSSVIDELQGAIQNAAYNAQLISASVRQHSIGMEQISSAMQNISSATEENLISTRHTRDSAQSLAELAGRLRELTGRYKTD
jgi:methyl-accepting chemotaxis protein